MENFQEISIEGRKYLIVDSIQDFRAEDSFIHRNNKLAQFKGNGESKKHVGTYKGELGEKMSNFFNYNKWGLEHFDKEKSRKTQNSATKMGAVIQDNTCFFSKSNLLKYLSDAEVEYKSQEQIYHKNIEEYYEQNLKAVLSLDTDIIRFTIYDASDNLSKKQNRGYIRSDNEIWKVWRKLILPGISYLSILKLISVDNLEAPPNYYFRILLDYQFRSFVHPKQDIQHKDIAEDEEVHKKYRAGQNVYRKSVIEFMPQCPFTKITDERLLIASHIKPYNICIKENNEDEALDYLNGLTLAPTYDRLFDQGYITFLDDGTLICGTQLSPYTWSRVNLNPNAKNKMRIYPEKREKYLAYHRNNVFQDSIDDLV